MKETKKEIVIKTMLGLGDAFYFYPIVKCYIEQGFRPTVVTRHPIIFNSLDCNAVLQTNKPVNLRPSYNSRRTSEHSQYKDILMSANLPDLPFEFKWGLGFTKEFIENKIESFMAAYVASKKRLCIIKEPCASHMHKRERDFSIVPDVDELQKYVNDNKDDYFFVSVGQDEIFYKRLENIDYDLNNQLEIQDLISLCSISHLIVTQIGHLVPISQALNIPLKVFYPKNPTDRRIQLLNRKKIEILGAGNLV